MLVMSTPQFFVFLDEDLYVQWLTAGDFDTTPAGEILNRVSYLETVSTTHFSGIPSEKKELAEFRRLLGECVARAFDNNLESAKALLNETETLLLERSVQRARQWYLIAALIATLGPVAGVTVLWYCRDSFRHTLGSPGFEVALCALLGGVGALVSTIISVRRINLNASFGPHLHYIEGVARIATGCVGASLVTLAIKGNLLLGSVNTISDPSAKLSCLCTLGLVAGVSERIVPNFIKRVESSTLEAGEDARPVGTNGVDRGT
jgi:hypothetical protein